MKKLKLFITGCEEINYEILMRLCKSKVEVVSDLNKEYKMSRCAFNRRINILESMGFLKRTAHKRDIVPTKLTFKFIKIIKFFNL